MEKEKYKLVVCSWVLLLLPACFTVLVLELAENLKLNLKLKVLLLTKRKKTIV